MLWTTPVDAGHSVDGRVDAMLTTDVGGWAAVHSSSFPQASSTACPPAIHRISLVSTRDIHGSGVTGSSRDGYPAGTSTALSPSDIHRVWRGGVDRRGSGSSAQVAIVDAGYSAVRGTCRAARDWHVARRSRVAGSFGIVRARSPTGLVRGFGSGGSAGRAAGRAAGRVAGGGSRRRRRVVAAAAGGGGGCRPAARAEARGRGGVPLARCAGDPLRVGSETRSLTTGPFLAVFGPA